jgi:hypothetical protein
MRPLILGLIVVLGGCQAASDSWAISSAKAAAAKELGNPEGLQFKFVEVRDQHDGDRVVCGYATTLTPSGAPDDVHRFYYSHGYVTVSPDGRIGAGEYPRRLESFDYFYGVYCKGQPFDPDKMSRLLRQ